MLVLLLVFVCAILYYLRFRKMRKALYDISNILPTVGDLPVLGHTHWFIGGPEKILSNLKQLANLIESSGGTSKIWIGPSLYYVTLNPEDVQKILENCLDKDSSYKFLRSWLGNGLFVAPVDLWKQHRRQLVPLFHHRIIEDYIDVFGQQSAILLQRLEEQVGKPEFDIYKYITSCMLDIVYETAMGEKMDVQHNPDTPYLRARSCVMSIINMRLFKAWLQPDALFKLTPYAKLQKENIDYTHKFTDEVVMKKKVEFEKHPEIKEGKKDLLELLLQKAQFNNEQLREHIDSITIAGNDTTALVIAYVLLLLGHHPEEQEKVYKELKTIFGDSKRHPTKDDLHEMDSNVTLPAGVGCAVVPFIMHRSKKLWGPDADSFVPDRFLPENSVNRHPCSFIPFSYGSRNCIGRHFGMQVMKSVLSTILLTYKIKSRAIDRLKIEILLFPVPGHMITIEKR
ncbi:hypothetical protein ACJJTC_010159 [Scirpophaga incertulas]